MSVHSSLIHSRKKKKKRSQLGCPAAGEWLTMGGIYVSQNPAPQEKGTNNLDESPGNYTQCPADYILYYPIFIAFLNDHILEMGSILVAKI